MRDRPRFGKFQTQLRNSKSIFSLHPSAMSGRFRPRYTIARLITRYIQTGRGRSRRITVSHALSLIARVPPKLPSMIHASRLTRSRTLPSHSSFGVRCQFGRQKTLSRWITPRPVALPSLRANVDLPEPPEPITTTLFIFRKARGEPLL